VALRLIRLELARTKEYPEGSSQHGYEFVAPLDAQGNLDMEEWRKHRGACTVWHFWGGDEERGQLIHGRHGWAFSYSPGDDDDEAIFRFASHQFRQGEYLSITEHDGRSHPFKVVWVKDPPQLATSR